MTQYEAVSLVGLISGPILAVLITLWHQDRARKRDEKQRLFITLMAQRKSFPPTYDWTNALNLIDVVYADTSKVVRSWHEAYDILCRRPQLDFQAWNHKYLELLSAMAGSLGYRALQQTDIDKFYSPEAHGNAAQQNAEILRELLRVLKSTKSLSVEIEASGN